jgi:hypothetical protein
MRLRSILSTRKDQAADDPAELVAQAEAAEADGRLLDAVDALARAEQLRRDTALERRLVRLRHHAYGEVRRAPGPAAWPVVPPGDDLIDAGVPAIDAAELDARALSTGILRHGGLHVRGLIPTETVERLRDGIDRAMEGFEANAAGTPPRETTPWYEPFKPDPEFTTFFKRKKKSVREGVGGDRKDQRPSGMWTAESPRVLADLVDAFDRTGLTAAIGGYLGERPVLSVAKCTLRRVGVDTIGGWHQDGAFMGDGIRTVNVWMALTDCGRDAPGLDLVPRRIDHVVETGTEGAHFPWSVSQAVVDREAAHSPVVRPTFTAGDVMIFDDLYLHRTGVDAAMTRERYAIETWCFAPSCYPDGQIPLVL